MFINVKLLNGFKNALIYKIPDDWQRENLIGSIVKVPIRNKIEMGIVEEAFAHLNDDINFEIKKAYSIEQFPDDKNYIKFIEKLSDYYVLDKIYFLKRIKNFIYQKERGLAPFSAPILKLDNFVDVSQNAQFESTSLQPASLNNLNLGTQPWTNDNVKLNSDQQDIFDKIKPTITHSKYDPCLIHGVTGSGKTEIYKKLILHALDLKKSTILLLPEVSLAIQFYNLFKKQFSENTRLFGFHSASSVKEKRALWQDILAKAPIIVIGVHLPILLPISNLGLIIIDEEHETGFQEKSNPKINSKEAAILRAKIYNIPIVLGSATPSLNSLYNVKTKEWHLFELKKRFAGDFPKISIVKLDNKKNRKNFWISKELEEAIRQKLNRKEQTIIFLNRRGYSFFIQCKACGFIPECIECSVSLTLHHNKQLQCHYCNYAISEPDICLSCKSNESNLLKKGIGTQQIVKILQKLFPDAKIDRADLDSTVNKKNWQKTVENFENGTIDILVGTQTITKGYHFPKVTLVGIIWADINLSFPIYNASEVTLQQILQVAGRAGRVNRQQKNDTPSSLVIVQTIKEHALYNFLEEKDYCKFYNYEINNRHLVQYPPCVRLIEIELKHNKEDLLEQEADELATALINASSKIDNNIKILGPAKPPVYKIKTTFIRKIYLKSFNFNNAVTVFKSINIKKYKSYINFTPNPQN